jgi:PAS domain S-box-containing protein
MIELSSNRGFNREAWDVQSLDSPGWGRRLFPAVALALFLFHAALLLAAPWRSATPLLSNSIQLACGLVAAWSCLSTSRRFDRFGKHFWLLVAAGFFVWSVAQTLVTYYDSILHVPLQGPWPSDIIFFLSMTPALMTLFISSERGLEWKDWPRVLDLAQAVILMVAAYLFVFAEPAHWKMSNGALARLAWLPDSGRDMFLAAAFTLRALLSRRKLARNLYGSMAIFFVLYLGGELPYLYLQATRNLPSGTPWDLAWSLPFLVVTILAAKSKPVTETLPIAGLANEREENRGRWGLVHILPMIFPLVVLLMAAGVAEKQLLVAVTMVLASFTCSSARIMFSERLRRESDLALEEKNALLHSIFDGTGDALYIKDGEGRYVIVNQAFAGFLGLSPEQIVGKSSEQLMDSVAANLLSEQDRAVIESGIVRSFEYEISTGEKPRAFFATKAPYRDASGKIIGLVGAFRDISEYRAMEDRLRQSQKMEAIGTLAGGVAHDFNNILMVISGYGSVLADALAAEPKLRGHVEQIQKAAERAASLTRQLLAFSRKQAIQPVPLNLNTVVTGIEKLLHRLIGENITITTKLPPDPGMVLADAGQMEQIILNLTINARDAMPDGGRLTLEIKNSEIASLTESPTNLKPGQYLELIVSDTGVGMNLNVQSRVFEPFFTTKPAGKGTGLGLSTVYGIVQQSNGHVTFTSQPGRGTTFRVYLPRIDSRQPAGLLTDTSTAALDGTETVLLVEDDPSVCELVRAVLTSHGYTVLSARRPQEAKQLCEIHAGRISLLLSDVIMPEMNGGELSRRLSESNPKMKVLFMSGYIDDALVRKGIKEKDVAFLQKPFSPLSLARKVREVLDGLRVA